jgi:prephenate dehydrogenase
MTTLAELRVTIVGLGLMGGSLAMALRPHVASLVAVDLEPATVAHATDIVERATTNLAEGLASAHLVILATPARAILATLAELPRLRPDGCLVMDLGSTKLAVTEAMDRLPPAFAAIGGHPMCGKERAGLAAAEAGLFQERTFVLCRTARTSEVVERAALAIVAAIGSRPLFLGPQEHDEIVAVVSHLPYLVAALLVKRAAESAGDETNTWAVSASGFRDAARLAGSDPAVMLDILLTNRQPILDQLDGLERSAAAFRALLERDDEAALRAWLDARQQEYRAYRQALDNAEAPGQG